MGYINILLKLLIALCFYIFLNVHARRPENHKYAFKVNYCIDKNKKDRGINESNIRTGLELISKRSCIKFSYNSTCYNDKKHCTRTCTYVCEKWEKNKTKKCKDCEKKYKKCTNKYNDCKKCKKYKKHSYCKKCSKKCKNCSKVCKKNCVVTSVQCTNKCRNVTLPFIRFFYDITKNYSDFNFNGSTSLWKENVYNMEIDVSCNKKPGCIAKKVLMYLGLIPTVRRKDSLFYIKLNYSNIKPEYQMQYMRLLLVPLNDTEYDYSSIAHFADSYGSNSSEPTFHLKKLTDKRVKLTGQEIRPTFLDLEWLYRAYCKNKFKPTVKCEKGFPKSDGSKKCECPTGYTGRSCKELQYYGDRKCPFQFKRAWESSTKQQLNFNGNTKCTVEITAPEGKRIRVHVETINCTSNNPCFEDDCLQIKYHPSMTNTDLCLCGTLKNISLWTLGNKALIQYKGKHGNDYAYMSFWSD